MSWDFATLIHEVPTSGVMSIFNLLTFHGKTISVNPLMDNEIGKKIFITCDNWHSSLGAVSERLQGLYSLSGKTSYRQISCCLEATRLDVEMIVSLWYWTCISAAAAEVLSNF